MNQRGAMIYFVSLSILVLTSCNKAANHLGMMEGASTSNQNTPKLKRERQRGQCRVCGLENSFGKRYGIPSCQACGDLFASYSKSLSTVDSYNLKCDPNRFNPNIRCTSTHPDSPERWCRGCKVGKCVQAGMKSKITEKMLFSNEIKQAVVNNDWNQVRDFIEENRVNINSTINFSINIDEPILQYVILSNQWDIVDLSIGKGTHISIEGLGRNHVHLLLSYLVTNRQWDVVRQLIENAYNIGLLVDYFAIKKHWDVVGELIGNADNVDFFVIENDNRRFHLLEYVIYEDKWDIVKKLINKGAQIGRLGKSQYGKLSLTKYVEKCCNCQEKDEIVASLEGMDFE